MKALNAAPAVLVVGAILASFDVGCASDQASRYFLSEKLPARAVEQVEVLLKPPTRAYEIVAEFQSRGEDAQDMRRKAASVGADAVIVVFAGGVRAANAEWASDQTYGDMYTRIIGTAIRYKGMP